MTTTITKETFKTKAKARYAEVDVEGWGRLGLRTVNPVLQSQRIGWIFEQKEQGNELPYHQQTVIGIVDQCMVDEATPMFTFEDIEWLAELDAAQLKGIMEAINNFNDAVEGKSEGGSSDTSES